MYKCEYNKHVIQTSNAQQPTTDMRLDLERLIISKNKSPVWNPYQNYRAAVYCMTLSDWYQLKAFMIYYNNIDKILLLGYHGKHASHLYWNITKTPLQISIKFKVETALKKIH